MIRQVVGVVVLVGMAFMSMGQINESKVAEFARQVSERSDYSLEELTVILNNAKYDQSIVDKISKPAEGTMTWERYRNIFMKEERITAGVKFWDEYAEVIKAVSEESGVAEEAIIGIIGVETYFGRIKGSYRVLDALYTLAFGYPKRSSYFTSELEKYLIIAKKEHLDVNTVKGSYAGAMGYCQFMPSSYEAYAKSYDQGTRDLMTPEDAIASVANYLKVHRWETGNQVTTQVASLINPQEVSTKSVKPSNTLRYYSDLGYMPSGNISPSAKAALIELDHEDGTMEYWFGFNNFYVITRYNHSKLYAMAVHQLGQAVKAAREGA
ncbi:lytic murein transglycosylase B [Marinoscillum sp.]|uniref:lytic murein transglycosylase B n=1 Tax=Marinoscillum sp. TaxID=2024838 RepID=UPI003BAB7F50